MKCPNCGSNLRYDPVKQLLVCESCNSSFTPEERASKKSDYAGEQDIKDTDEDSEENSDGYLYTCPACGAELIGTYNTSAVGYCTYCGGQSILKSRLNDAVRPDYIIPFSKTKQDCCNEYLSMVAKLPFVPSALKDKDYINEIRGIYIPYYTYVADTEGTLKLKGSEYKGNYEYVYHVSSDFKGSVEVPVDASLQMDDDIGYKLFPDNDEDVVEFDEDYMTGFYAEMPDVSNDVYREPAISRVKDFIVRLFNKNFKEDNIKYARRSDDPGQQQIDIGDDSYYITLIPAYFLTYRKDDRVCYTIFSGKNDKKRKNVYSSVPVDFKLYFLAVCLLTLLSTAVLSFLPILITHGEVMNVLSAISSASVYLIWLSMRRQAKDIDRRGKPMPDLLQIKPSILSNIPGNLAFVMIVGGFVVLQFHFGIFFMLFTGFLFPLGAAGASIFPFIMGLITASKHKYEIKPGSLVFMFIMCQIISLFALVSNALYFPDGLFYAVMSVVICVLFISMFGLYKQYNLECTRALPHFTRKGGNNSANG